MRSLPGQAGKQRTNWLRDDMEAPTSAQHPVLARGGTAAGGQAAVTAEVPTPTNGLLLDITFEVNGRTRCLSVDPRVSLLDALTNHLALTGTKKACNQGACGACTVLLNGKRINACLTFAVMHSGARITTIEGLASGAELHPLQRAFIKHDAFQCGYCTPGQIVSGCACISEGHAGSPDEIRRWMSGNICRCGAYPGIIAAIAEAADIS
jgi:xanthine dehydrogenase YagT iron-sulfur-binding subunit